ncbi:Vicilin-like antimicrobial peptides 2-2 [Dendrobium catenatum]|uniref:Vicilin-like antimicrobial peptides 2-2 n=1 Tax=Dendrobium catenatum TaxID=906689 RepID=A0A2I0VNA0_9ASPA|nr:Vicilin-like antimicrobial peptides 2-2 [Dendrobium catenatum]
METWKQGSGRLPAIFFCLLIAVAVTADRGVWEVPGDEGGSHEWAPFLMKKSEVVVKTEGGEIRVFRGHPWNGHPPRMHIGFVTMEPNTLMIPHYLDADLILFLLRGEAKIGWIHKDDFVDRQLKPGDVLRIPAGSAFYVVNTGKEHRLQIVASIEPIGTDLIPDLFTPFYIGGGEYPLSVLAGFDIRTLAAAFHVRTFALYQTPVIHAVLATPEEVGVLTLGRTAGPIIFIHGNEADYLQQLNGAVKSAMETMKKTRRLAQDVNGKIEMEAKEEKKKGACTLTSILSPIFSGEPSTEMNEARRPVGDPVKAPDAYNIYDRDPDFRNDYGWSIEVNEHDYLPLKQSDISVFLVNLSAGSMMAPHVNPRATEYGVVVSGAGTVEVVYPNGTGAMKAKVKEGDVFWVPRFFPFSQVAASHGPMEILGFTTSARRNRPQFLVGKNSILRLMMGKELAAGFGVREEELRQVVMKQNNTVILPSWEENEE